MYVIKTKAVSSLTYGTGNIDAIRFICPILYEPYYIDHMILVIISYAFISRLVNIIFNGVNMVSSRPMMRFKGTLM